MRNRKTLAEVPQDPTATASKMLHAHSTPRPELDSKFTELYAELRRVAVAIKRADAYATVSTSTLLHETWLKLAGSRGSVPESKLHFTRIAARVMRQIIVDDARKRYAHKRGGMTSFVTFDDSIDIPLSNDDDVLRLNSALDDLNKVNPRQAELVQLRFFGGLEVDEAASLLGVAASTAIRDWRVAKAWLAAEVLKGNQPGARAGASSLKARS